MSRLIIHLFRSGIVWEPIKSIKLPKEIGGSEIRERRGSAAAAEGESGLLVRPDHRRGWRKGRRALRAVARVVSLADGGANRRLGVAVRLPVRVEFRAGAAARRSRDFGPVEGWRRRRRKRQRRGGLARRRRDGDGRRRRCRRRVAATRGHVVGVPDEMDGWLRRGCSGRRHFGRHVD